MSSRAIDTSPPIGDEVKYTTCYMCACRCGIKVHLKGGAIRYIEGNRNHPVNRGVLCAKGSAGIMQHYSPARLKKPLKRTGPRGSGEFKEIEWDEALAIATDWLEPIRRGPPPKQLLEVGHANEDVLAVALLGHGPRDHRHRVDEIPRLSIFLFSLLPSESES